MKIINMIFKYKHKFNDFCVLLTASIDPKGCIRLKRSDPKIREQDYLKSLKLWLTKTKFKIVFCENSGYDLKNIRELCNKYPGRVEIIQFDGNNYPRHLGKGYGEFKIIEKAMNDSVFIKESENIIKVTGRVFIKNIYELVNSYDYTSIVDFFVNVKVNPVKVYTVIFIFKREFFNYFKLDADSMNDDKGIYFEYIFRDTLKIICDNGFKYSLFKKVDYVGYSGTDDIKYEIIFHINEKNKFILLQNLLGKIGRYLKSKTPFIYKLLKPYFPDKK